MDGHDYRREVYEVFASREMEIEEKVSRALDVGAEYFGLDIGFLTRIEDGTQTIVRAVGDHEEIQSGMSCPLDEAYCQRTITAEGPLAVEGNATAKGIPDSAVRTFGLGSYIGTKVLVEGDTYGTVCFADTAAHRLSFTESDEVFIELLATLFGQALEQRRHRQRLDRRNKRLQQRAQLLEGIAENSADILFRTGLDGCFTYVSAAVEDILGYRPDDLLGERIDEHIDSESVRDAAHAYARVAGGDGVENLELAFTDCDDETVILEVNATSITDDGGVVGVQGVARDATARKARERELALKNRAMGESEVGISIVDNRQSDMPLVYVNGGFERLTGYDADEAVGRNCRFLQGEATDPTTVERVGEALDAGRPVSVELLNYRKDGTPFWNYLQINPIEDESGDVTHFLGFQTDVTARKRSEHLVEVLNRVLRHNLRNDMNLVLGYGDLLQESTQSDPSSLGTRIESTARDLIDLSEQARTLEKTARRKRQPERLELSELCQDIRRECTEVFPSATVDVDIKTDRDVCAGAELRRALTELVENALKHDPSADPWVRIEASDDGDEVELTVEDAGAGINEMEARAVSRKDTALEHGSGLGLWLVNWIVTRYGGGFRIQPKGDDDGSIATARLPGVDETTDVETAARKPTVLFR